MTNNSQLCVRWNTFSFIVRVAADWTLTNCKTNVCRLLLMFVFFFLSQFDTWTNLQDSNYLMFMIVNLSKDTGATLMWCSLSDDLTWPERSSLSSPALSSVSVSVSSPEPPRFLGSETDRRPGRPPSCPNPSLLLDRRSSIKDHFNHYNIRTVWLCLNKKIIINFKAHSSNKIMSLQNDGEDHSNPLMYKGFCHIFVCLLLFFIYWGIERFSFMKMNQSDGL